MREKQELVSIILNCYNGEKYLKDALETVINQSYYNWELIFWDNKSNDRSKKIFDTYKSKKLKYFQSKEHTSLYEARNLAVKKCNGDYIAFIDADDFWEKDKLEKQIKLFENKHVGVVYGNLWILNEKLRKKKIFSKKKLLKGKIFNNIFSDYKIGVITTVIRKKILIQNNIKFESSYNHIGDFDLFIKLSKICEFETVQEPVATYRVHGENLSLKNTKKEIEEMKNWLQLNKEVLNKLQEKQFMTRIHNREFVNIKLNKNFFHTLKFFLKSSYLIKHFKNYILLFTPLFILKKIMWYQ